MFLKEKPEINKKSELNKKSKNLLSLQSGKGGQETVPDWKFVGQKVQRSFGKVAKQQQQQRGVNCHQGPESQN